jgi:hypothetical protein
MANLGIGINPTKSLVSSDTFEFAKRLFHNNQEVTGFPLAGYMSKTVSWLNIYSVTASAMRRGYTASSLRSFPFLSAVSKTCLGKYGDLSRSRRFARSILTQLELKRLNPNVHLLSELFGGNVSCNNSQLFIELMKREKLTQLTFETGTLAQESMLIADTYVSDIQDTLRSVWDNRTVLPSALPPKALALSERVEGLFKEVKEFTNKQDMLASQDVSVNDVKTWIEQREFRVFDPSSLTFEPRRSERGIVKSSTLAKKSITKLMAGNFSPKR